MPSIAPIEWLQHNRTRAILQVAMPEVSSGVGVGPLQKVELRLDKREGCRKQAEAQGLGLLERIQFVRKCME